MQARNVCRRFKEYSYLFTFYTLMYCVLIRCSLVFEIPLQRASIRNKYPLLKYNYTIRALKNSLLMFKQTKNVLIYDQTSNSSTNETLLQISFLISQLKCGFFSLSWFASHFFHICLAPLSIKAGLTCTLL